MSGEVNVIPTLRKFRGGAVKKTPCSFATKNLYQWLPFQTPMETVVDMFRKLGLRQVGGCKID